MKNTDTMSNLFDSHSSRFLEMALGNGYNERIEQPDGYGKRSGDCGDTVEIFIILNRNGISHASFQTDGCIHTHACANAIVHLIRNKTVASAWGITPESVESYLETLPDDHRHCAELAVGALYKALVDCREVRDRPWKRVYRKI